jgi:hypothetical protein
MLDTSRGIKWWRWPVLRIARVTWGERGVRSASHQDNSGTLAHVCMISIRLVKISSSHLSTVLSEHVKLMPRTRSEQTLLAR